jgi:hypothetical protein
LKLSIVSSGTLRIKTCAIAITLCYHL